MEQTPIEKALEHELYTDRMIVLLENSCGFHQVMLTKKQYKAVSDACVRQVVSTDPITHEEDVLIRLGDNCISHDAFNGMTNYET